MWVVQDKEETDRSTMSERQKGTNLDCSWKGTSPESSTSDIVLEYIEGI